MTTVDIRDSYKQLAAEMSGQYEPDNFIKGQAYPKVIVQIRKWTLTLTASDLGHGLLQTTISADYPFEFGCRFTLCQGGACFISDKIGSHIKIGDPDFDKHFHMKTKDSSILQELLSDKLLKEHLRSFKSIRLEMRKSDNAHTLEFSDGIIIVDIPGLNDLFHLLANILDKIHELNYPPEGART